MTYLIATLTIQMLTTFIIHLDKYLWHDSETSSEAFVFENV